jgi:hypothetical protein
MPKGVLFFAPCDTQYRKKQIKTRIVNDSQSGFSIR